MSEFRVIEALTAPNPTDRQWVIRQAAELIIRDGIAPTDRNVKAYCMVGVGQLCNDAAFYLADCTELMWRKLIKDVQLTVSVASATEWEF